MAHSDAGVAHQPLVFAPIAHMAGFVVHISSIGHVASCLLPPVVIGRLRHRWLSWLLPRLRQPRLALLLRWWLPFVSVPVSAFFAFVQLFVFLILARRFVHLP